MKADAGEVWLKRQAQMMAKHLRKVANGCGHDIQKAMLKSDLKGRKQNNNNINIRLTRAHQG